MESLDEIRQDVGFVLEIKNSNQSKKFLTTVEKYIHKNLANISVTIYEDHKFIKEYCSDVIRTKSKYFIEFCEELKIPKKSYNTGEFFYVDMSKNELYQIIKSALDDDLDVILTLEATETEPESYFKEQKNIFVKKHSFTAYNYDKNIIFLFKATAQEVVDGYSYDSIGGKIPLDKNTIYCGVGDSDYICGLEFDDAIDYESDEEYNKYFPKYKEEINIQNNTQNILKEIEKCIDTNSAQIDIFHMGETVYTSEICKSGSTPAKDMLKNRTINKKHKGDFIYRCNKGDINNIFNQIKYNHNLLDAEKFLLIIVALFTKDMKFESNGDPVGITDNEIIKVHSYTVVGENCEDVIALFKNSTEIISQYIELKNNLVFYGFDKDDVKSNFE